MLRHITVEILHFLHMLNRALVLSFPVNEQDREMPVFPAGYCGGDMKQNG